VGYGEGLGKDERITVDELAKNPRKFKPYLVGASDQNTKSFIRRIWQEQQRNPKFQGPRIGDPESTVRWFAIEIDPQTGQVVAVRPVGYSPQPESFSKNKNVNKTYYEITKRLRHTIETAQSPEDLQKSLSKDKAGVKISPEEAEALFKRKSDLKSMSDEELYAILKPTNAHVKYDPGINNVTTSEEMAKNKTNFIFADIGKAWMTGGTEVQGGARANPKNPFIEIENFWLPGEAPVISGEGRLLGPGQKTAEIVRENVKEAPVQEVEPRSTFDSETGGYIEMPKETPTVTETPIKPVELAPKLTQEAPKPTVQPKVVLETKTPSISEKSEGVLQALVNRGKLTQKEAEPFIEKEKKIAEINDAASSRYVTEAEKDLHIKLSKELNTFLKDKNILKKSVITSAIRSSRKDPIYSGTKNREIKDTRTDKLAEVVEQENAISTAKELVAEGKPGFEEGVLRIANKFTNKSPWTEQKILDLIGEQKTRTPKVLDKQIAQNYGLELKEDGFLKLDRSGNPSFSSEFVQKVPEAAGKDPVAFWGSPLAKDLAANTKLKTVHSEKFAADLKTMDGEFDF